MRAAERRAAAEHEVEWLGVGLGNGCEGLDDVSVLLDERGTRQVERLLDFEQVLESGGSKIPCVYAGYGARSCYAQGALKWIAEVRADPCPIGYRRPKSMLFMAGHRGKLLRPAMEPWMTHERIEINPEIMGGKPVIRGTRVPVKSCCANSEPA